MEKFNFEDVENAYENIHPYIKDTPLEESYFLNNNSSKYFFKLESMQKAKSFKIRGALNKMLSLSEEEKEKGVATVSSGNHGSSVAYAANLLGIKKVKIYVPNSTPESKTFKIEYFGGEVIRIGKDYDEAHGLGMAEIKKSGMTYIDAYYDDPKIYSGQGTIAIEILKQNPSIDTIVVPIGGGGLITGIAVAAKAIKPKIKIIGVQTEACPSMIKSYEDNIFYEEYPSTDTYCDALVGGVGKLSYEMLKDYVDDIIEVTEESIAQAVAFMAKEEKYIAEAGSCTTIAAVQQAPDRIPGSNIALVISGANIDGSILKEILTKY
ncbi:Threonine dehydratase [Lactococcus cremoris]|uniref:threonine ammonia-lyase n=1 Tax=Lactococcus lactis subsp. cremoris TaxID=1359 RepID=A0A166JM52_LACLC|nr:pyridoxal-phosphate dependent enzyme [Lactococcus cremoris]KZK06408.1 Threonine dehydratase [Lactococcus cremoris]